MGEYEEFSFDETPKPEPPKPKPLPKNLTQTPSALDGKGSTFWNTLSKGASTSPSGASAAPSSGASLDLAKLLGGNRTTSSAVNQEKHLTAKSSTPSLVAEKSKTSTSRPTDRTTTQTLPDPDQDALLPENVSDDLPVQINGEENHPSYVDPQAKPVIQERIFEFACSQPQGVARKRNLDELFKDDSTEVRKMTIGKKTVATIGLGNDYLTGGVTALRKMNKLSQMLCSSMVKTEAGTPTCFDIGKYICIGTTHGLILVFDLDESMRKIVGGSITADFGRVTAIASPAACTQLPKDRENWIACGYEYGEVVLWDLHSAKPLKIIKDAIETATMGVKSNEPKLRDVEKERLDNKIQGKSFPITHIEWVGSEAAKLIACDASGAMLVHEFKSRLLGLSGIACESSVLLTGERSGPILATSSLPNGASHPVDAFEFFCFATTKRLHLMAFDAPVSGMKGLVQGIRTRTVKEKFKFPRPLEATPNGIGTDNSVSLPLPYIAWRKAYKEGGGRVKDPILAIGWGTKIQLIQMVPDITQLKIDEADDRDDITGFDFHPIAEFYTSFEITGLSWLNHQTLAYMNNREELHIIDPYGKEEIETVDMRRLFVIGNELLGKLAGSSKASVSYHNALFKYKNRLHILGDAGLITIELQTWLDSINGLAQKRKWRDAIMLCYDFYDGHGTTAVGLPRDRALAEGEAKDRLLAMLGPYLADALDPERVRKYKLENLPINCERVVIEFCIKLDKLDFLFSALMPIEEKFGRRTEFVEALIPYALHGKVNYVPKDVLVEISQKLYDSGRAQLLEKFVLSLNADLIDFDAAIEISKKYGLYGAIIKLYNNRNEDYVTPLELLFDCFIGVPDNRPEAMQRQWHLPETKQKSLHEKIGRIALCYCAWCLKGQHYPSAEPINPPRKAMQARNEVGAYLFAKFLPRYLKEYPVIFYFASFDAKGFFEALQPLFTGKVYNEKVKPGKYGDCPKRQEIADIIFHVCIDPLLLPLDSKSQVSSWVFNDEQQSHALVFIASNYSKGLISVTTDLQKRLISYFFSTVEQKPISHAECEDILLPIVSQLIKEEVLRCGGEAALAKAKAEYAREATKMMGMGIKMPGPDYPSLILSAEGAGYYRISELLFTKTREFRRCILARLRYCKSIAELQPPKMSSDGNTAYERWEEKKLSIFDLINSLFNDATLTPDDVEDVKSAAIASLPQLALLDGTSTTNLVLNNFLDDHERIVAKLKGLPEVKFAYMRELMSPEGRNKLRQNDPRYAFPKEYHEDYIDLLCRFAPQSVLQYLNASDDCPLDVALKACEKYNLLEPTLFVLERMGDIGTALQLVFKSISTQTLLLATAYQKKLFEYIKVPIDQLPEFPSLKEEKNLCDTLQHGINLFQRNGTGKAENEMQTLWFRLLDAIFTPLRVFKSGTEPPNSTGISYLSTQKDLSQPEAKKHSALMIRALTSLARKTLETMMNLVKIPTIIEKILHDHENDDFGDFRTIILGILEMYVFETSMLQSANRLFEADICNGLEELMGLKSRAHIITAPCDLCGVSLSKPVEFGSGAIAQGGAVRSPQASVAFRCGHCFHIACCQNSSYCQLCNKVLHQRAVAEGRARQAAIMQAPPEQQKILIQRRTPTRLEIGFRLAIKAAIAAQQTPGSIGRKTLTKAQQEVLQIREVQRQQQQLQKEKSEKPETGTQTNDRPLDLHGMRLMNYLERERNLKESSIRNKIDSLSKNDFQPSFGIRSRYLL